MVRKSLRGLLNKYYECLLAAFVFLAAMAVYLVTLAPTVTLVDSGELILASHSLGIAHPPGFPLYVLLGWLLAHLPLGTVAQRLNFMSALFAAGAAAVLFLAFSAAEGLDRDLSPRRWIPALVAALSFAFSLTLWTWATVAEVYTLNTFLICVMLCVLLAGRKRRLKARGKADRGQGRADLLATHGLYALAFLYGLALGNHHITILLLAPAFLYLVASTAGWRFLITRQALLAIPALLLGLGIYLYLPLRAGQDPLLNWGDPSTLQRFIWHVTGKQYQVNLFSSSLGHILEQLAYFLGLWIRQFTPLGAGLALLGIWTLWQRDRWLLWFTLLIVGFDVLYAINYEIASDIEAYYLPAFLVTALWLGWGVAALLAWIARWGEWSNRTALSLLLLVPVVILVTNYRRCDKSQYYIAYDYAMNTLKGIERGGLLLTQEWQLYSPLLYLQPVEGVRPDVAVIDTSLLRRSWYFQYLENRYPALMAAVREEADAFLEQLHLFEHDLPYDENEIQRRYVAVINALIAEGVASGSAYLTMPMEEGVGAGYQWVPQGLAFRLYADEQARPLSALDLNYRGLSDNTVYLEPEALHVRRNYALMLVNHGTYLATQEGPPAAIPFYLKAVELDPDCSLAHQLLADAHAAEGQ